MGPKKGVISQSVKDVIQSLVDDDLVAKDKIGISVSSFYSSLTSFIFVCVLPFIYRLTVLIIMQMKVYFWSLPSCAGNQVTNSSQSYR